MKRLLPALLIVVTLFMTAIGFLLPGFLSGTQDETLQNQVDVCETSSILFHPVSQLEDSFLLLEDGSAFDAPKNAHTKLDADGAFLAAKNMLQTIGFLSVGSYTDHTEALFLAVSKYNLSSALIWKCEFSGTECSLILLIDDNTGEMLAFRQVDSLNSLIAGNYELFTDQLSSACALYYGWEFESFVPKKTQYAQAVESEPENAAESGAGYAGFLLYGVITLKNSSGREIQIPMDLTRNSCTFGNTAVFQKICS